MTRSLWTAALLVLLSAASLALYLFRPFLAYPEPAALPCLDPRDGHLEALGAPAQIYGLGLSYAGHIAESPGLYDPNTGPPIFRKRRHSVNRGGELRYPNTETLLDGVRNLDPAHADRLAALLPEIPPLLDYEVEIGLAVLESFHVRELDQPDFVPPLGFFVANDVTARILIGMAPRFDETVAYIAEGKSLPGFLPVGDDVWIPAKPGPNSWLCVQLRTEVNGELRQSASSSDIIVGPREILAEVATRFELGGFESGDWIVTGTPPGVASQVPGWLQRATALLDPAAKTKLSMMIRSASSNPAYLRPGDVVTVSAGILGRKTSRVVR